MFHIMSGKYYVGGYSPVYNLVTLTGKTQAKVFKTQEDADDFLDEYSDCINGEPEVIEKF